MGLLRHQYSVMQPQILVTAEQAFLVFLEDAQEAFIIMTQHASRRRATRDQSSTASSSDTVGSPSSGVDPNTGIPSWGSPPISITAAHVEFMAKLADVTARLPRGNAGQPLSAIAASISSKMTTVQ